MRHFTTTGLLSIAFWGLAAHTAPVFAQNTNPQNTNQWYGWAQCSVTVEGPAIDGNGTILGQYFHQETQTWELTNTAVPNGNTYPATWSVNGHGWETIGSGRSWTLASPAINAPLQILQRASDHDWLISAAAHSQITGQWAVITPAMAPPTTSELVFPSVIGSPQALMINGSSSFTDAGGKYGTLQPGGPTTQVSCSWKFSKGAYPPPPIRQTGGNGSNNGPQMKPANAPAGSVFVPIAPCRVVDTRAAHAAWRAPIGIYPTAPATFQIAGAGNTCGIPAVGPTALSLNVTAIPLEALAAMSIRPIGQAASPVELLSALDGLPTANAAILPFGSGAVEVSVTNRSHVVIDVNGYFMPTANAPHGNAFYPVVPCTALNTMAAPAAPLPAAASQDVDVRTPCKIPTWATAVVMEVTVAPLNNFLGFLTVWATGQPRPVTSNLNAYDGQIKSNLVIAQLGATGHVSFFSSDATNASATVVGYFGAPGNSGALAFHPTSACVAANTQWANGPDGGPALDAYTTRDFPIGQSSACGVPGWARAYALNLIATPTVTLTGLDVRPSGPGNITAWSLYARDGQPAASAALVAAGTGGISVTPYSPTHLILVALGYFD